MPSLEMKAYVRLMSIYDVSICQPHRFLAGSAHLLHLDEDGKECGNDWDGASMSLVADVIYETMVHLVDNPNDIISENKMLTIFDKWKEEELDGHVPGCLFLRPGKSTLEKAVFLRPGKSALKKAPCQGVKKAPGSKGRKKRTVSQSFQKMRRIYF